MWKRTALIVFALVAVTVSAATEEIPDLIETFDGKASEADYSSEDSPVLLETPDFPGEASHTGKVVFNEVKLPAAKEEESTAVVFLSEQAEAQPEKSRFLTELELSGKASDVVAVTDMVALQVEVNAQIAEIERTFQDPNEDTSDMSFSGVLLLNDIKQKAMTAFVQTSGKAKKAVEKDESKASEELMNEVKKLIDRLRGRLISHINIVANERQKCADLNAAYKRDIDNADRNMKVIKGEIREHHATITNNLNRRDESIKEMHVAVATIRKVYYLRQTDRATFRYNTAKRKRANSIIDEAIAMVCTLDDSKGEPKCKDLKADIENKNIGGSKSSAMSNMSSALKAFSKSLLQVRDRNMAQVLTRAKSFLETKVQGQQTMKGENAFLLDLLTAMKDKNVANQVKDERHLAKNIFAYNSQEANLVRTVNEKKAEQENLKSQNMALEGKIDAKNVENDQLFRQMTRDQIALRDNIERCDYQEIDFAAKFVRLESQIGIALRLQSLLRTLDYKGKPKCDDVSNCGGENNGYCIFAGTTSDSAMCVCKKTHSGDRCQDRRCPTERENLLVEYTHQSWVCSGRGSCNKGTGACTCNVERVYHGPNNGCERKSCPTYQQAQCGGSARMTSCHSFHGNCRCRPNFRGESCDFQTCPQGCGFYSRGSCDGRGQCACRHGWTGTTCNERGCHSGCGDNIQGSCIRTGAKAGKCGCRNGYYGSRCQNKECPFDCSDHGVCDVSKGECICKEGFGGTPSCESTDFHVHYGKFTIGSSNEGDWDGDKRNTALGYYIEFPKVHSEKSCNEPTVIPSIVGHGDTSSPIFKPDTFSMTMRYVGKKGFWVNIARVDSWPDYAKDGYKTMWGNTLDIHYAVYCHTPATTSEEAGKLLVPSKDYNGSGTNVHRNRRIQLRNRFGSSNLKWSMGVEYPSARTAVFALTHYGRDTIGTYVNVVRVSECEGGTVANKFNIGTCGWEESLYIHYHVTSADVNFRPSHHSTIGAPANSFGIVQFANGTTYNPNGSGGSRSNTKVLNNQCSYYKCQRPDLKCQKGWEDWEVCTDARKNPQKCWVSGNSHRHSNCSRQIVNTTWTNVRTLVRVYYAWRPCSGYWFWWNWCHQRVEQWENVPTPTHTYQTVCTFNPAYASDVTCKTNCPYPSTPKNQCNNLKNNTVDNRVVFNSGFRCSDAKKVVLRTTMRNSGNYDDTFSHTVYGVSTTGFYVNYARIDNCHGDRNRGLFPCTGWGQHPYMEYAVTCLEN